MCLSSIRDGRKSLTTSALATYLRAQSITQVPAWLIAAAADLQGEQLISWWYDRAAESIISHERIPAVSDKFPTTIRGEAFASLTAQLIDAGWLSLDSTGIIYLSKERKAEFRTITSKQSST